MHTKRISKPWGWYEVLHEDTDYKVKLLHFGPHCQTSRQYHNQRSEHWTVLSGSITAELNETFQHLEQGDSLNVPRETIHQIMNNDLKPALILEIQLGTCEEEDIIRL